MRRCRVYPWCAGHLAGGVREHRAEPVRVPARDGHELVLTLTAVDPDAPQVEVEVVLEPGQPSLEVAVLDADDIVRAATALRRLAVEGEHHQDPEPVPNDPA
jgi:hypothetical protein